MALATSSPGADLNAPVDLCEVTDPTPGIPAWRACDKKATQVIIATNAPGYCPVCDFHAEQFQREAPHATVRVVSLAQFETERANGLYPSSPTAP